MKKFSFTLLRSSKFCFSFIAQYIHLLPSKANPKKCPKKSLVSTVNDTQHSHERFISKLNIWGTPGWDQPSLPQMWNRKEAELGNISAVWGDAKRAFFLTFGPRMMHFFDNLRPFSEIFIPDTSGVLLGFTLAKTFPSSNLKGSATFIKTFQLHNDPQLIHFLTQSSPCGS